jgi:hypothetical protein
MEPYAEPVLDVPELSASWYVALSQESLEPRRGINELRSKVIPALAELEQRGMDDFRRDEMREFRILWGEQVGRRSSWTACPSTPLNEEIQTRMSPRST